MNKDFIWTDALVKEFYEKWHSDRHYNQVVNELLPKAIDNFKATHTVKEEVSSERGEEDRLMNTPCLSVSDVMQLDEDVEITGMNGKKLSNGEGYCLFHQDRLKQLAASKIKQ